MYFSCVSCGKCKSEKIYISYSIFYKIFDNVYTFYQENPSSNIQETICLLHKVQFLDIPPIHLLMDWEYPQTHQHDFNIYSISCVSFV